MLFNSSPIINQDILLKQCHELYVVRDIDLSLVQVPMTLTSPQMMMTDSHKKVEVTHIVQDLAPNKIPYQVINCHLISLKVNILCNTASSGKSHTVHNTCAPLSTHLCIRDELPGCT